MKTIEYTNANGDNVTIESLDGALIAVWLFGCNILARLNAVQRAYILTLI